MCETKVLIMKIHGVLCFVILFALDTCNCKCDEYIILLKQTGSPEHFHPLKTEDLNELVSFYNATGTYNDLDSFKNCILEMECQGYTTFCPKKVLITNHGKHFEELTNRTMDEDCITGNGTNVCNRSQSDHIENEDQTLYDLNIIHVNKNDIHNKTDLSGNKPKNTMFMVVCDYAENACDDDDVDQTNLNNYINITNDIAINETMEELNITLKRDESSEIQPIFTGFASKNLTTGSTEHTPLEVTFTCKYKENTHCKRKVNNSSEENLPVPRISINVYLNNDYVKNGTNTKYQDCKKNPGDTNILCDGKNFTYIYRDVLFSIPINSEHDETFNLHCQVSDSYLPTETKRPNDVSQNDNNLLHFNSCYRHQNISNITDFGQQIFTLFLKGTRGINNNTTHNGIEFNKTKEPLTIMEDKVDMNAENLVKIHINTDKRNNCTQNQLFGITEGQIIDEGKLFITEDIPKYGDVELKLLNCLNETYLFDNNTNTYGHQSKLIIFFENGTDIEKTDKELDEPTESISIVLVCNPSYHDEHEHKIDSNEKIVFECESMAVNNYTTTKINSSNILPNVTKDETMNEENKANCSSNATDNTFCAPKCGNENVDECNTNNKKKESKDENGLDNNKYNLTIGSKDANDSQSNGSDNLTIENGDSVERIGLIILVSVAGAAFLIALILRKFARGGEYRPAPVRETQDLEDTAF